MHAIINSLPPRCFARLCTNLNPSQVLSWYHPDGSAFLYVGDTHTRPTCCQHLVWQRGGEAQAGSLAWSGHHLPRPSVLLSGMKTEEHERMDSSVQQSPLIFIPWWPCFGVHPARYLPRYLSAPHRCWNEASIATMRCWLASIDPNCCDGSVARSQGCRCASARPRRSPSAYLNSPPPLSFDATS